MSTLIFILLFPALVALSEAQICYNSKNDSLVEFMPYWIPKQGEADVSRDGQIIRLGTGEQNTPIIGVNGTEIARVDNATAGACRYNGGCLLLNGDLLALDVTANFTYRQLDKTKFPFGMGTWGAPLQPFVSVAAPDVPSQRTLCVTQLENFKLPNNKTHNGCVRVDDQMGVWPNNTYSCDIALFVLEFPYSVQLQSSLRNATVYSCSCEILNYTTPDMYEFANGAVPIVPQPVPQPVPQSPTVPRSQKRSNSTSTIMWVGIASCIVLFFALVILLGLYAWNVKKSHQIQHHQTSTTQPPGSEEEEYKIMGAGTRMFSLTSLKVATAKFDPRNKLGEGGFGAVYKGVLPDGTQVAVKQLSKSSKQGTEEFMNEVSLIGQSIHKNLVRLYGYCLESDERLLVYEYLEKGSLHQALFGQSAHLQELDWPARFKIIQGTAKGLTYLHQAQRRIVHRDIKASNILLDKDLAPKISDFGLAKFFAEDESHVSTKIAGTMGYLAPEYASSGMLTEKADIFSFGVLTLEIVSGRKNMDLTAPASKVLLLEWTWDLYEKGRVFELLDSKLTPEGDYFDEVVSVVHIALLCAQGTPHKRPAMQQVLSMLQGQRGITFEPTRPEFLKSHSAILHSTPVTSI